MMEMVSPGEMSMWSKVSGLPFLVKPGHTVMVISPSLLMGFEFRHLVLTLIDNFFLIRIIWNPD